MPSNEKVNYNQVKLSAPTSRDKLDQDKETDSINDTDYPMNGSDVISEDKIISKSNCAKNGIDIPNKKMNSPEALFQFFGKERAEKKKKENKIKPTETPTGIPTENQKQISNADSIRSHIETQIVKLQKAHLTLHGWKDVVHDHDQNKVCTEFDIFHIRIKSCYLARLYSICLEYYDTISDFNDLARLTILSVNKVYDNLEEETDELHTIRNHKTLLTWFRSYQDSGDVFINPSSSKLHSIKKAPKFLYENPDALKSVLSFCRENLERLTVDLVHDHIKNTVFPAVTKEIARDNPTFTIDDLMQQYRLKTLNPKTVYNWMIRLGFKHEPHQKSYYVDNHEAPENVSYRNEFVRRYFQYELSCHRWISITSAERDKFIKEGTLDKDMCCYKYEQNNQVLYEYHVDDHYIFQKRCDKL